MRLKPHSYTIGGFGLVLTNCLPREIGLLGSSLPDAVGVKLELGRSLSEAGPKNLFVVSPLSASLLRMPVT